MVHQHSLQSVDPDAAQLPRVYFPSQTLSPDAPKPAHGYMARSAKTEADSPAAMPPKVPLIAVVWMSVAMSMMSCLGVLPYFFVRQLSKPWAGLANAVASGVMLAASFSLLAEGSVYSGAYLVAGMLLGVLFVKFSQKHLEKFEVDTFEQLVGADARKVILFLAVMAVHAVGEGGGVGVSFAGDRGWAQGTLITLAIGLHNVPEGLAVATVMTSKGAHPSRALLWTTLTAMPQALVAPPAYLFVDAFRVLLPLALGFAAGCMLWIVLAELLPDALEAVEAQEVATYATGAAACLQGLSVFMSQLETPSGTLASPFADYQEVLPLGLSHLLLRLLLACLVPALVAALSVTALRSKHQKVCSAAGLLAAISMVSILKSLISSNHQFLSGLLLPLVGAATAAGLYSQTLRDNRRNLKRQKLHSNGCVHLTAAVMSALQQEGNRTLQHAACVAPVSSEACQPTPAAQIHNDPVEQDGSQVWQQYASSLRQHQNVGTLAGLVVNGASWCSASVHSSSSSWLPQQLHQHYQQLEDVGERSLWCQKSPLKLTAHSPLQLHVEHEQELSKCPASLGEGKYSDDWLGCSCFSKTTNECSNSPVTAACRLALCGAAGCAVPLGLQLASAFATAPNNINHALVPMALLGAAFGAIVLGLMAQLLGRMSTPLLVNTGAAAIFSSTAAAVALSVLLVKPAWVQRGFMLLAVDVLQGLLVGFNIAMLLFLLDAANKHWGKTRCSMGLAAGFSAGLLICMCIGLLCWGTPYCVL
jgi:zinc transporter ZupT